MFTRFVIVGIILLVFPASMHALDLSAAQERLCVQMGHVAVSVGEARDAQAPRSAALLLPERAEYLSPALRTWGVGLVYWVYEHHELRSSELYIPIVLACRQEIAERELAAMQDRRGKDMASICETMADIGAAIAGKTATLTQVQSLAHWRVVLPDTLVLNSSEVSTSYVEKLVPFVYQRKRMAPTSLRVAITQQCLNDLATELHTQFGGGVRR